jgi:hypothetical protein
MLLSVHVVLKTVFQDLCGMQFWGTKQSLRRILNFLGR